MRTVIHTQRPGWTWVRACTFSSGRSLYYRSWTRIALVWAVAAVVFTLVAWGVCR